MAGGKASSSNKPSGELRIFRARSKGALGGIFPAIYNIGYAATEDMEREYGLRVHSMIMGWVGEDQVSAMDSESDCRALGNALVKRMIDNPQWLDGLIAWCEGQKDLLVDALEGRLPRSRLKDATNNEIAEAFGSFVEAYKAYHIRNMPAWWFGGEELEVELAACVAEGKMTSEQLAFLLEMTEYTSEVASEELDALAIAAAIKGKAGASRIKAMVRKHTMEYFHLPFGYANGVVWDERHFMEGAQGLAKEFKSPAEERARRLEAAKEKNRRQRALIKELGIDARTEKMIWAAHKTRYLQDLKKTVQVRGHPYYDVVMGEVAKRLGIEKGMTKMMSVEEIQASLADGAVGRKLLDEVRARCGESVNIYSDYRYTWLLGKDAVDYCRRNKMIISVEEVKEITGSPASGGNVRGPVRVCLTSNEISKVREGDILVTAMTTPDFVPAMKVAGAIVTDEGGILCHAAIISRELNKPCVIGTKNATKVLRDGMIVDVDAQTGKIRIV